VHGNTQDYNGDLQVEEVDIWCRDPVECVQELIGNPMFRDHLSYAPKKLFTDGMKDEQIFNEMDTAEWWWGIQV
jgi:hypothetical protein